MASPGALARTIIAGAVAGLLSAALSAAPLDCEKLKVSVQPEPPGYAAQCLGKSVAPAAPKGPAAPNAGNTYYVNLRSGASVTNQKVLSATNPSLNYVVVGAQTLPIFALDFDNTATTLYGIDNASRNLGTISTTTGAFTPTTAVTGVTGDTISGMSFDPTSSSVYISVTNGTPVTSASLYTLNIATGAATLVGPIAATGNPPAIVDIAITNEGDLYAHDVGGDRILKVDKTTAAVVEIGATGYDANFAQGMDVDADTNTLWLALYQGGGQQRLGRVDLWNGTVTILQSTGNEELEMAIQNVQPSGKCEPVAFQVYDVDDNLQVVGMNETLTLHPIWKNIGTTPIPGGTGSVTAFAGAPGPTYNLHDPNATYAEMPPGGLITTGDGYEFSIDGITRPEPHFDASMLEVLPHANAFKSWTLHVGGSFTDVSPSSGFYPFIEGALHSGVTVGCGPQFFCPTTPVTREQMAVFTLVAKMGAGYVPPPCVPPNTFGDVPETSGFCPHIEELERRQVVVGCGGGNYCPTLFVTREQMSVFLGRTRFGPDYNPPPCTTPIFADVPASSPFCRWVEDAKRREVTAGCAPDLYCPSDPVTREQMSVFALVALGPRLNWLPTATPSFRSGGAGVEHGGPRGGDAAGLAFLLIGFASAIGLPIALSGADKAGERART